MTTFDYAIVGSIACGLIMVCGGILLLYKGAISLEVASKDEALTLEIFENQFKLTTRIPALGLFVIGLIFIGISIYYTKDTAATPIQVTGKTHNINEEVTVNVRSLWVVPTQSGQVFHILRPNLDVLWVEISAPGYEPLKIPFPKNRTREGINFGDVTLKQIVDRIDVKSENIMTLPSAIISPPLSNAGQFGSGGS